MKVSREKACQRLHHRISTPLIVTVAGENYSAVDWSLGGFRLTGWKQQQSFEVGSKVSCCVELPFQGFNIAFEVESEIVRIFAESSEVALRFVKLEDRQRELLQHFVDQLVRGSMIPVQDTILRIDSPVTPVSTKPDPNPLGQVPINRLPLKMIAMSMVYFSLGIILLLMTSVTVYENFLNLKVSTAITSVPVEPLISHSDGYIKRVNVRVDKFVGEGTPLLQVDSPSIERKINIAKIFIEQKKIELEEKRKKYALAIDFTGSPASKESRTLEIEVDAVQQEVSLAMQNLVALYDYEKSLTIESPSQGRLIRLFRQQGAQVKNGETIGVFERNELPVVHAYVSADEARLITMNLLAKVRIINLEKQWLGRVINIQSDKNYISNNDISYIPDNIDGKDFLVEIEIYKDSDDVEFNRINSGMAAEVLFPASFFGKTINKFFNSKEKIVHHKDDYQWST
jgi:biotin carboxyl carrier protein